MLRNGGGNTAVFITEKGVVLVDTKNPGWGRAILDKVKTLTDKPVTMIINTHTHGDHVGSNEAFSPTVEFVAHENTKANMEKMPAFAGRQAGLSAEANLHGPAEPPRRERSRRALLLRPRPHERRHLHRLSVSPDGAPRGISSPPGRRRSSTRTTAAAASNTRRHWRRPWLESRTSKPSSRDTVR